eukprot:scaffold596_cov236-Pinguiococcus_pyrenoidosus.AAC.10
MWRLRSAGGILAVLCAFRSAALCGGHGAADETAHRHSHECGTERPSPADLHARRLGSAHRDIVEHVYAHVRARRRQLSGATSSAYIVIPRMVYHVVHDGSTGLVSDSQLQYQHDRLNEAFAPYIQFGAWERRDYDDAQVFRQGCAQRRTLMRDFQVAKADTTALNTYLIVCLSSQLLGYAHYPFDFAEENPRHGVVIDYQTIDSDECNGGCSGATAIHEWGHGFGLYHTFEALTVEAPACDCTWGDLVDDTPPEASPAFGGFSQGCRRLKQRDTCTEDGQKDPVWNYMDYSDDTCMERFTQGQFYRMLYILAETKPNLLAASLGGDWCTPGTFLNEERQRCETCPEGTYQDEAGQSTCKPCPQGSAEQSVFGNDESLNLGLRVSAMQCHPSADCVFGWLGDSYCDGANNKHECFYDGGDCCAECCSESSSSNFGCGDGNVGQTAFQQCKDPTCAGSRLSLQATEPGKCANYFTATHTPSALPSEFVSLSPSQAPLSEPSQFPSPAEPTQAVPSLSPEEPSRQPTEEPSLSPTPSPSERSRRTSELELYVSELPFDSGERSLIFLMEEVLAESLYGAFEVSSSDGSLASALLYATTPKPSPSDRRLARSPRDRDLVSFDPQWYMTATISILDDVLEESVLSGAFSADEALQYLEAKFVDDVRSQRFSAIVGATIEHWPEPIVFDPEYFRSGDRIFVMKQDYSGEESPEGGPDSGDDSGNPIPDFVHSPTLYYVAFLIAIFGGTLLGIHLLRGSTTEDRCDDQNGESDDDLSKHSDVCKQQMRCLGGVAALFSFMVFARAEMPRSATHGPAPSVAGSWMCVQEIPGRGWRMSICKNKHRMPNGGRGLSFMWGAAHPASSLRMIQLPGMESLARKETRMTSSGGVSHSFALGFLVSWFLGFLVSFSISLSTRPHPTHVASRYPAAAREDCLGCRALC